MSKFDDLEDFFYGPDAPVPEHLVKPIIEKCLRGAHAKRLRHVVDCWYIKADEINAQELKQMVESYESPRAKRKHVSHNESTDEINRQVRRLNRWLVGEVDESDL